MNIVNCIEVQLREFKISAGHIGDVGIADMYVPCL